MDEPTAALGVAQTAMVLEPRPPARRPRARRAARLAQHERRVRGRRPHRGAAPRPAWSRVRPAAEMDTQIVVDLMTTGASTARSARDRHDRHDRATRRADRRRRGRRARRRRDRGRRRPRASPVARATTCGVVYVRIRSGESGVLPVVGGLLLISILFQSLNSNFLTAGQPRQPADPGRGLHAAGDGRGLRPAARRDRPVDRVRQRHRRHHHRRAGEAVSTAGRGGPRSSSRCSCARRSARCRARSSRGSACRRSS